MGDQRYEYQRVNALKIIVENDEGKLLIIKEPVTNEWMPGHWGLPGGKPLSEESLIESYQRKVKGDLGMDLELRGIYKLVELLIENRTVLMFIVVARVLDNIDVNGEVDDYKWVGEDEIKSMDIAEFTEYYNKEILLSYLGSDRKLIPADFVKSYPYFKMSENVDYKRWLDSGKKK